MSGIGIGDDDGGAQNLARGQADTLRGAVADEDLVHLGTESDQAALPFDDAHHGVGDRLHAADGVVDAVFLLEMRDERVHRRHVHRVAADEERVKRQSHAQAFVLHPRAGVAEDRAVGAEKRELGDDLERVPEPVHRLGHHAFVADDVAALGIPKEPLVALDVAGREAADLVDHALGVAGRGEVRAVGPADRVERVHRAEVDVGVEVASAGGPEFLEDRRRCDDGGSEVEAVAAVFERRAAAAGAVQPVEHGHAIALGAEAHGGGKAAQPGADDDGVCAGIGHGLHGQASLRTATGYMCQARFTILDQCPFVTAEVLFIFQPECVKLG